MVWPNGHYRNVNTRLAVGGVRLVFRFKPACAHVPRTGRLMVKQHFIQLAEHHNYAWGQSVQQRWEEQADGSRVGRRGPEEQAKAAKVKGSGCLWLASSHEIVAGLLA